MTISDYRLPDGTTPVLLSADTPDLVRAEAAALLSYVNDHPAATPDRVAATLFRTRIARRHRALAMVHTRDELCAALRSVADGVAHPSVVSSPTPARARRLAFVLPGQGSQRHGMGALFYERMPAYRVEVDRCDALFGELFDRSPLGYLLGHNEADESTVTVQSALFMQMVGLGAMWRAMGIEPDAVVGHSQGEIAAAYLAGKVTLDDAVVIVGTRSRAMETISSDDHAMGIITADRDECEAVLARESGWAQVSVINSPHMVGISGERATVARVVDTFAAQGKFTRMIPVRYPAHTAMVNDFRDLIRDAVHERLQNPRFLDTDIDCIGGTLGDSITTQMPAGDYWFWNLRNTVRFDRAVAKAYGNGVDAFVELSEHPALQLAVRDNLDALAADSVVVTGTSVKSAADLAEVTRNLATLAVNDVAYSWEALRSRSYRPLPPPLLDFPNTRMNEVRLWLPYQSTAAATPTTEPDTRAVVEPLSDSAADGEKAQLLVENWVRLARRSMLPPRSIGVVDHTGACADLADALCAHAQSQEVTARRIETGADAGDLDTIVVLLPAMPPMDQAAAVAQIADFFVEKQWWCKPGSAVSSYWLVTVDGESVLPDDVAPQPVHAAVSAGFRCLRGELLDIAFRHLDLPGDQSPEDAARCLVAALHTADEPEIAVRQGDFYVKRLVDGDPPSSRTIAAGDHVLITGGTGRLGLEFCEHAAQVGARRITLVSRTGRTSAVDQRVAHIARSGSVDIRVIACDVADGGAVERLAEEIGAVDVLIHTVMDGAGGTEVELAEITEQWVDQITIGKAVGISNLVESVALTDDCRIVLCSSMAATFGGRGKIVYAAANRLLDAFAYRLRAAGRNCVSVQWGQWATYVGHNDSDIASMAGVGYRPMRSADAIALGLGRLPGNAAVAAFDWGQARNVLGLLGFGPTLSQLAIAPPAPPPPVAADARPAVVKLLAEVIGADDLSAMDPTRSLVSAGLDSLHALEFRRRVVVQFGVEVPVPDLMGGACIDDVVRIIGGEATAPPKPAVAPHPTPGGDPRRVLLNLLAAVLGADDLAAMDPTRSLVSVGLNSLHALEFRRRVLADFGADLRVAELMGGASFDDVVRAVGGGSAARTAVEPTEIDSDRMSSARRDLDLFGLRAMERVLQPVLGDGGAHTADEIAAGLGFADRHRWVLRQWLDELVGHGCLVDDGGYRKVRQVPAPGRADLVDVCRDLGYAPPFAQFLTACNDRLADLVGDRVSVQELLFPDGSTAIADVFYRDNLVSRYLNGVARDAVAEAVKRVASERRPVQILELGAGVGGMTDEVVRGLTDSDVDYHFTDMSTFFLNAAKERYANHPWMRYGIVDLNEDLQQLPPQDVVIASNVLHNARHIGRTMHQLHALVRPGGAVVFIEVCKAHCNFMTSVYFLMSPRSGQPNVGLDDVRAGTDRIFLTQDEWRAQLSESGFTSTLMLPEPTDPLGLLDQHVFAVVRGADAARQPVEPLSRLG